MGIIAPSIALQSKYAVFATYLLSLTLSNSKPNQTKPKLTVYK